jgi:hypothetical protein
MPNWIFYGVLFLFASFVVLNGGLMLVVPNVHRKFLNWITQSDRWSGPATMYPQGGLEIERRLAGLVLTGMGLYFAWGAIAGFLNIKMSSEHVPAAQNIGGNWLTIVIGVGVLGFGLYAVTQPGSIIKWSLTHQVTPREIPDSTLRLWKTGARALGVALIVGGVYTLWVALRV